MNNSKIVRFWILFILLSLLGGCAIGFDHTLFVTKSNVGVDIDTKPPTAEISIARRELVIAPAFEGGQTPPVLAGFRTANRLLFGFDVSSVFAGGDAAYVLTQQPGDGGQTPLLCLNAKPEGKLHLGPIPLGTYSLPSTGEIRPFVFGTDTSFGLKVAWSGMTAQFPDSLKIGFNRKEFALAPVFGRVNTNANCPFSVGMPPFLASIEIASDSATPQSFATTYRQSFSTGTAAVKLANNPYIKELLLTRLDRAEEGTFVKDKDGDCIVQWIKEDETQRSIRIKETKGWLTANGHVGNSLPLLIRAVEFTEERQQFIKDKNINCLSGG